MSKGKMEYFKSYEHFWEAVRTFNALYSDLGWTKSRAQKDHIDVFGKKVETGEDYFKRQVGGYHQTEKLAMSSMERLVYLLIVNNPALAELGEHQEQQRHQAMMCIRA